MFYLVNASLVGVAVALYVDQPVGRYVRDDLGFSAVTAAVLLCLAPIVVVALRAMPELYPLFIVLLLAVYSAGRQTARRHHEAMHDRLTGLINRQRFCEIVDERIAAREPRLAILLLDLDRFKDVNDALGHAYGDRMLQQVAAAAGRRGAAPRADRAAGRRRVRRAARAGRWASATRWPRPAASPTALRGPFEVEGVALDGEASIGVVMYPEDGGDSDTLLQRGDVAMYRAKDRAGRTTRATAARTTTTAPRGSGSWRSCAARSRAASSSCTTSRRSTCAAASVCGQRGARALGASRARPAAPGRVHAARREHEHDPAADAAACSRRRWRT